MGELIVKRYPTSLLLKAADHTYVECGTGARGWGCWGGKTGGTFLRQGIGSTLRADVIAEPDEKAHISCYLINGVCHQASNRILQPAGITADGARGYTLSVVVFGPYGREKTWFKECQAPLLDHSHISGDLLECVRDDVQEVRVDTWLDSDELYDYRDLAYMSAVAEIYESSSFDAPGARTPFETQMELFRVLVAHRLRRSKKALEQAKFQRLMDARQQFEVGRLELEHEISGMDQRLEFAAHFNKLTLTLQDNLAEIVDSQEYEALLGLARDERIVVADPDILNENYEPGPDPFGRSP